LPKKYLNSQVRIILEPLNIEKDVLGILLEEGVLSETIGIYITGSYTRGEQSIESDIDILVVTSKTEKRIKKEKYDLLLVTKETLENQLKNNIMPLLPMIIEAKPIINKNLLVNYKNTKLTKKNTKWHIDIAKSGLKVNKAALNLENDLESRYASDAISYSLILHLRSTYIVGKLMKNKPWSNKELIGLIKKITGSVLAYEGYQRVKADKKRIKNLPINEAEKLYEYLVNEIKKQEKSI
jgi:predicted nucleotidyltransferase